MLRVWWTVPGSAVAWEWRPAVPRLFAAKRVVAADGIEYLEYGEEIPGPPRPYMGLPAGQGLADQLIKLRITVAAPPLRVGPGRGLIGQAQLGAVELGCRRSGGLHQGAAAQGQGEGDKE